MIAEIGLAALWLAAGLCALQFIAGVLGVREAGADGAVHPVSALARPAAVVQGLLLLVAFACLLRVFAVTDLSVALVADNSHVDKPFIYRLSAAWGNHEGSMLLWVTILGLSGGLVALFERRMDDRFMKAVLAAQAFIALGFLAFLLFSSNPFARPPISEPGSTRCCRISASRSIRPRSTSAMSACRLRSASSSPGL